jgi:hypothetical protein
MYVYSCGSLSSNAPFARSHSARSSTMARDAA